MVATSRVVCSRHVCSAQFVCKVFIQILERRLFRDRFHLLPLSCTHTTTVEKKKSFSIVKAYEGMLLEVTGAADSRATQYIHSRRQPLLRRHALARSGTTRLCLCRHQLRHKPEQQTTFRTTHEWRLTSGRLFGREDWPALFFFKARVPV